MILLRVCRAGYWRHHYLAIFVAISVHVSRIIPLVLVCEKYVDNNQIDASLGLAVSLELLKKYKRSGLLHAEVRRLPISGGVGKACLQLVRGVTASVYLENPQGHQFPISEGELLKLDKERGPLAWSFSIESTQPTSQPNTRNPEVRSPTNYLETSAGRPPETAVPVVIAPLEWENIMNWTQQQQILYSLYRMIDGRKNIREIKTATSTLLPATVVDEALQVLLKLKVVRIIG